MFENASLLLSGISSGQPIPITLSQSTNPWQFAINCGLVLVTSVGILAVPMLLSGGNPIKKAKSLKEFNRITGRPSIVIDHSRQSLFKPAMIDQKTVTDILNAMSRLGGRNFNLIITSGGGAVFSSQLISDAMLNYKGQIHVYVNRYAMSGASLLTLSGSHIHLNDFSAIGCIDPQVGSMLSQGSARGWNEIVKLKGVKANDNSILHARVGAQVEKSIRENVVKAINGKTLKVQEVADFLTNGEVEHIKQIKMQDLLNFGFNNIYKISDREQKLLCNIVG
jgi:ClpP class serine protease